MTCPVCKHLARIRAQIHVASSYDGDATGRFHDRFYQIEERMAWWSDSDQRFDDWMESADPNQRPHIREACYASCASCNAALCVVIEFEELRPMRVIMTVREDEWPKGYLR